MERGVPGSPFCLLCNAQDPESRTFLVLSQCSYSHLGWDYRPTRGHDSSFPVRTVSHHLHDIRYFVSNSTPSPNPRVIAAEVTSGIESTRQVVGGTCPLGSFSRSSLIKHHFYDWCSQPQASQAFHPGSQHSHGSSYCAHISALFPSKEYNARHETPTDFPQSH